MYFLFYIFVGGNIFCSTTEIVCIEATLDLDVFKFSVREDIPILHAHKESNQYEILFYYKLIKSMNSILSITNDNSIFFMDDGFSEVLLVICEYTLYFSLCYRF